MASTSSLDHQSYVVTTTTLTIIVSPTPIYRPTKHPTTSAAQATSGSVRNLYTDASFSRFPNDFLAIQNGAWVRPTFIAFSTFIATCLVASLVYYGWRWHKKRKPSEGAFVELVSLLLLSLSPLVFSTNTNNRNPTQTSGTQTLRLQTRLNHHPPQQPSQIRNPHFASCP